MGLTILQPIIAEEDEARFAPDGRPICSPSQHDKLSGNEAGCHAAWGFRYWHGQKVEKPSTEKGKDLHNRQETYFKFRQLPSSDDIGLAALSGLKYLPLPHSSLLIEHYFAIEMAPGYWERGKIDIYDPERVAPLADLDHPIGIYAEKDAGPWPTHDTKGRPIPLIIDHKSTGDFKWMKNDAVLRGIGALKGDPQPAIYGTKACMDYYATYGELPLWVHFRWVYYLLKKGEARAKCVDLRMRPSELRETLMRWLPDLDIIHQYWEAWKSGAITDANKLPKNPRACGKYGGCEFGPKYLNICQLEAGKRLGAAMSNNIPLAQQVTSFLTGGGQQQQQGGGMFGSVNGPEAQQSHQQMQQGGGMQSGGMFGNAAVNTQQGQQQAPAQGGMFGGGHQQQQQPQAAAGGMFGNAGAQTQQQAPAQGGMFGGQSQAPAGNGQQQAAGGGMFGANTQQQAPAQQQMTQQQPQQGAMFGNFTQQAPETVDPRMAQIPANVPVERRAEWLKHCDANNLDHITGQPKAAGQVPATIPQSTQPNQQNGAELFKQQALSIYQAGKVPDQTTHPEVARIFQAIVTMSGPNAGMMQMQQNQQQQPAAEAPKRKRRTKAEMQAAAAQGQAGIFAQPDVQAFLREMRDFFDSFLIGE